MLKLTKNDSIKYLKKNFDDIAILGTLCKVAWDNASTLDSDEWIVINAFRRYSPQFQEASLGEIGDYLSDFNENQMLGVVNNVKGILHEIEYVQMENDDGDSVKAALFQSTNHPGTDVQLFDEATGDKWEIQLKATDNTSYVQDWIDSHPDGEILVTDELAEKMGLPSSDLENEEITYRVEDVTDRLIDLSDEDELWDYFPLLAPVSISIIIWDLWKRYKNKEISLDKFKRKAARVAGIKASKIAGICVLMSIPGINVVTGAALVAKLIYSADSMLSGK